MINHIDKNTPFIPKFPMMEHQASIFKEIAGKKYYALFWEMGTGKSKLLLDDACRLFLAGEIDGVLITTDKGFYMNWPDNEIPKHMPDNIPYRVGVYNSHMNAKATRRANEILAAKDDCLDFCIINIEALGTAGGFAFASQFLQSHYAMMAIDEATSIKNHKAIRTQACIRLRDRAEYRRIMTGTPITQGPLDVYAMCEFLSPGCLGFSKFVAFRAHYANVQLVVMGPRRFNQIVGYRNLDHLHDNLSKIGSRILKSDCLDLPDKVYEVIHVEHTPEQKKLYNQLRDEAVLQLDQGLLTSTSALTTIGKLQQINCGHLKLDSGVVIDIPSNRIPMLLNLVELIPGKKIIWAQFQKDIELITRALQEKYGHKSTVSYYGPTSTDDRRDAIGAFNSDPQCMNFVATTGAAGKSLTLVEATTSIYYSSNYKLEHRLQSEDRNHRIGQTKSVTYIDLIVRGTVDVKILAAHRTKKDLAFAVLDEVRDLLTEADDELPM